MTFSAGTKLGTYEIVGPLGAGGMGEVYRARDTKLKREVALKVLPDAFARDAERVARFQGEAEVLASLNHPHIAAIYDLQEAKDSSFLILELIEGETLADRIARGPIPIDESLAIAKQIAEALEAAHEKGIIHRDLKPANIKLTDDGNVKVLDFGLAKAFAGEPAEVNLSNSPTLNIGTTRAGVILGTAAYMSPEQAQGAAVDRRTDIFAFGCVLYEMLTGRRAFQGETVVDILAAVLKVEPDWSRLPKEVPPTIRRLLRRCLQKDRRRRLPDAGYARIEIEDAHTEPEPSEHAVTSAPPRTRARLAWIVAALLFAVAVTLAVPYVRAPAETPELRLEINTPATTDPISLALSPDGRQLVFVASADGQSRLWLRRLDAATAQPMAGTEAASYPFWSPDSRSIGFFADGKLKRIDLIGGPPQVLADAYARGGTWSADGVILFTPTNASPLFRVSASGGEAVAVTKLDPQLSHRFPYFLPGGRQFLFYVSGPTERMGIYLGSLDSAESKRLAFSLAAGVYLPSGWLLFTRAETLVAQRLDLAQGALTGEAVTVANPVSFDAAGASAVSVSATGLLVYRAGREARRQLTWFNRSGQVLGSMGSPDENDLGSPRLSPDGRRVAVHRTVQGNIDIWLLDAARMSRLTFGASIDRFPIWSPDGSRVVFDSNPKGRRNLYQKRSDGAGGEELLLESPQDKLAFGWSADGRFILYQSTDPQAGRDMWILPLEGDRKPWVFLKTNFEDRQGDLSPDGRWVVYASNQSGRYEIYVRPFQGQSSPGAADDRTGGQWQVSTVGGLFPRWQADGKELYYIAPDGKLMAAPITVNGATVEPGTPVALFQTRIWGGGTDNGQGRQYDVARDGGFLINTVLEEAASSPITLLQNWRPPAK